MVMFVLTAVDQLGELREFSCQLPDIDSGFDVLSELAAKGNILVNARLFEEDRWTPLPPEAFDGQPISPRIRKLQKDWQQILNQPRQ